MLARIRQWRRQVKQSLSLFRPEEEAAIAVPEPPPPPAAPEPPPQPLTPRNKPMKEVLAWEYLKGEGLEIGALHLPMPLPPNARARYVDRLDVEGLLRQYPELKNLPLVPVDILDDGEKLNRVPNGSQDFVIASHFIEHTQDPIGTIKRFLEVLKPGGILFLAFPDKRGSWDKLRALTPLEHLYRDHEEGPEWSRLAHFYDFAALYHEVGDDRTKEEIDAIAKKWLEMNYSIHFHVWTHTTFWEMLISIRDRYGLPFDIYSLFYNQAGSESIVVLAKT